MKSGTTLGPYRVESLIGAGGMGEVYLATDTRLDRSVAIKILSKQLSGNAALRERFEREAKAISSLSHPNICALFDIGQHEGSDYLVMEYVQGETLADRINRGALRAEEVIRIGIEIANALDRAHKQGIIHRDLKPGNVMITKSGVKLLDFGLAKLTISGGPASSPATSLATEQKPLTEQGAILGTFQYMSPEQLEGNEADARSDIFALGAILYEMATGRRAFHGTSKASLIASILDRDPQPMSEIQPMTPRALERLVRACLMKDADDRLQTAHDVALELKWISESSSISEPMAQRRRKQAVPWIVTAVCAAAAVASGALYYREQTKPLSPYSLSIAPPKDQNLTDAVISPDGTMVAFIAVGRDGEPALWVRRLDDPTPKRLAKGDGPELWSPDGKWIAYGVMPGKLMRIRVDGGEPEVVCTTPMQGRGSWGEDGTILFAPRFGAGLSTVAATGGEPLVVSTLDPKRRESFHGEPRFLPGGKRYLFLIHTVSEKRNEIYAGSLDGIKPKFILAADALVGYSDPYLLFVRDGAIYAQQFDVSALRTLGEPRRVVDNAPYAESEAASRASVSRNGALTYFAYQPTSVVLNLHDRSGAVTRTLWKSENIGSPRLSADGKLLVVTKYDPSKGAADLYVVELSRGIATRITGGLASNTRPVLSSDAQSVAFQSDRDGMYDLYVKGTDGASPERVLWKSDYDKTPLSWSPDGKYLLASEWRPQTRSDIWIVPTSGSEKPSLFIQSDQSDSDAVFSLDGKWVAYTSEQSGEAEIYLRGFPTGRAVRVSTAGGAAPSWSPDRSEILFATKAGEVMVAPVRLSGTTPEVDVPKKLFDIRDPWTSPRFTPDGKILIGTRESKTTQLLEVTTAWKSKGE